MPIRFLEVAAEAWALFRRDRDWLLRLSAPFLFLPPFALALFVPSPPVPATDAADREARALEWAQGVASWIGANGPWYLLAYAVSAFGAAALYAAYLDPRTGDLRGALGRAGSLLPRYLLAQLLVAAPVGAGLLLWIVPGLYLMGRTLLVGPVLVAERPVSALGGVARAFRLTRGAGLAAMGLASAVLLGGYLLAQPFALLAGTAEGESAAGAISAIGVAAASMAANLAQILVAVAAYRRAGARNGI